MTSCLWTFSGLSSDYRDCLHFCVFRVYWQDDSIVDSFLIQTPVVTFPAIAGIDFPWLFQVFLVCSPKQLVDSGFFEGVWWLSVSDVFCLLPLLVHSYKFWRQGDGWKCYTLEYIEDGFNWTIPQQEVCHMTRLLHQVGHWLLEAEINKDHH